MDKTEGVSDRFGYAAFAGAGGAVYTYLDADPSPTGKSGATR